MASASHRASFVTYTPSASAFIFELQPPGQGLLLSPLSFDAVASSVKVYFAFATGKPNKVEGFAEGKGGFRPVAGQFNNWVDFYGATLIARQIFSIHPLPEAFSQVEYQSWGQRQLPRMISKKIQQSKLIDFTTANFGLNDAIEKFQEIGLERMLKIESLTTFDRYVMKFFYDGITPVEEEASSAA
ncbi:hypothetical protein M2281_005628 [Mesorhizobium soli]|uniref:hypothetical protein n=1 Tax=Pseudaminobacter soli (ex Li et al. 2025) TaxID=1295366 RepID=UPI002475B491|nr:hypothetical protein [Mesorhizobium soli]MDH6235006.1 hypothetical protein [Mesorhizobium soli]